MDWSTKLSDLLRSKGRSTGTKRCLQMMRNGYIYPCIGGGVWNGRYFTQHALERMAPNTQKMLKLLTARGANTAGIKLRGIPRSVVEAELSHPGRTGVTVISTSSGGNAGKVIITAYERSLVKPSNKKLRKGEIQKLIAGLHFFSLEKLSIIEESELALRHGEEIVLQLSTFPLFDGQNHIVDKRVAKVKQAAVDRQRSSARVRKIALALDYPANSSWMKKAMVASRKMINKAVKVIRRYKALVDTNSQLSYESSKTARTSWVNKYQGTGNIILLDHMRRDPYQLSARLIRRRKIRKMATVLDHPSHYPSKTVSIELILKHKKVIPCWVDN